jgi:hypothetical protein
MTALQTLMLGCQQLQQLPPLVTLTALQALKLWSCFQLQKLPPLATLTALRKLQLFKCFQLKQLPLLASLTALQTLSLRECPQLQQLPSLATLTALQILELFACDQVQQLPPMATLTALQTLMLASCQKLKKLPSLATLTALQTLDLRGSCRLQKDFLKLPSTQGCKASPRGCTTTTLHVLRDAHVAVPTELGEHSRASGERSCPVETVADAPLGRPLNSFRLKGFAIKLTRASCFRLACCGVPRTAGPDALNP